MQTTFTVETIQELCKRTAQIHERSFTLPKKEQKGFSYGYYSINLDKAADLACQQMGVDQRIARLVSLSLYDTWNDTLNWANTYLCPATTFHLCCA